MGDFEVKLRISSLPAADLFFRFDAVLLVHLTSLALKIDDANEN